MFPANDSPRMNGQEDHSATERKVFIDFFFFLDPTFFWRKKKKVEIQNIGLYIHI